jgi:beta-lactam-binding protein with PASTA domain
MNQRLTVQRWDEEITGSQPPLTVLRQYPEPNKRVRPGTGIRIVLEAVSVAVPNVVGQHKSNAAALLGQEQLTLGTITERVTGQHTVGVVFQQNPEPGQRVKPGTKVHLQAEAVSVLVPGIVGLSRELAGNKLRNLNLVFGNMTKEVRDNVTDDTILNQSPGPGQRVALHTPVSVTFSVRGTRVPNLGRQSQQAAMKILHTHNLRLGSVATRESNHRNHWGTILDQSPRSGTLVQFGSQVNIVVGSRAMCTVPNVVGMNAVNADNTIRANRLAPRNNKRVTGTKNRVSRQYPAAGKRIYCGDTVSYDAFSVVQMAPMKPGTILTIPKNIQIIPPSRID